MLTKLAVDRYLVPIPHPATLYFDPWLSHDAWTGISQLAGLYMAVVVLGFVFRLRPNVSDAVDRPEGHVRFAPEVDGASTDARCCLLRQKSSRTIGHACHNGRRRSQRPVCFGTGHDHGRHPDAVIRDRRYVQAKSGNDRADASRHALRRTNHNTVPPQGIPELPPDPHRHRQNQCVSAGTYRRHRGPSIVQSRRAQQQEFAAINRDHMLAFKDSIIAYGWFYPVVEFLGMLALAFLLAYGGFRIRHGALTLGILVAFFQYGLRFFRPIQDLSEKYNILQGAMAASERIFKLLDTWPRIVSPETFAPFPAGPVDIEFDHVWFAYNDEEWVLKDISFRVDPAETVAIVGHTGAGKTTLMNLLLRFYDVQRGAIRIGGIDVRALDLGDLRRHFGVVLQDPYLFTGTVDTNIRLGTPGITQAIVRRSADAGELIGFRRGVTGAIWTPVRESGTQFSTGQKQLISFARASLTIRVF